MRSVFGSACLLAVTASAQTTMLTQNIRSWSGNIPLVKQRASRDKNWALSGQTGWRKESGSEDLTMEIAFIVSTTDDGIDVSESIASDDVIIVSWALPNVNDTEDLAELEAGVMQYYADASPE